MTNSQNSSPRTAAFIRIFKAVMLIGILGYLAFFVYQNATNDNAQHPFKLGLDLAGGAHLVYEADVTGVSSLEVKELMSVLRDVTPVTSARTFGGGAAWRN